MTHQRDAADATEAPGAAGTADVAVVGAGVVGCAIARAFALEGARVVVVDKAPDPLDGASKANSAILHTGFDAPPGTLEARCVAEGYAEYLSIREKLGLPLDEAGALVIAWSDDEADRLPALLDQARENGVEDAEPLDAAATCAAEPQLGPGVRAAFRVPREFLIDPWSAPHAYLLQALLNGATFLRGAEVRGGRREGDIWTLDTTRGGVRARLVVNAAGLFGDRLEQALTGDSDFEIRPRKGQFVVYDKSAAALARHILLPVPTETTKGVVVCRTIWGNLLVGPTAEEQEDRDRAALDRETLAALKARGERILPALAGHDVTASYAGLRPATERKEYRVRARPEIGYVAVGGIRSTGLSAALGLARHVVREAGVVASAPPPAAPVWPVMPNLAENAPRDWRAPGHGGIVCHCEMVTRREIEAALTGPLPARSFAGVKRRTRAAMGRCQGYYCAAGLAALLEGRIENPRACEGADG